MGIRTGLVLALLSLAACGPDAELVASGKAHSCRLQKATRQLVKTPTNDALITEVRESTVFLQSVIDSAGDGNRAELGKAIAGAVAKGCD